MIKVTSNADKLKNLEWPKTFDFPPQIGDWIEASNGSRAKITLITHKLEGAEIYVDNPLFH